MKKNILNCLALFGAATMGLAACGQQAPASSSSVEESSSKGEESSSEVSSEVASSAEESTVSPEIMADITMVKLHYHRPDAEYADWDVWGWDKGNNLGGASYKFTDTDVYGVVAPIDLSLVNPLGEVDILGFIVRRGGDSWSEKDPGPDITVDVSGEALGGILNIYFKSGSEKVYFSEEDALKTTIDSAVLNASDTHEVKVTFEGN
nr:hypothetical protein [Bacilli bacterium]